MKCGKEGQTFIIIVCHVYNNIYSQYNTENKLCKTGVNKQQTSWGSPFE